MLRIHVPPKKVYPHIDSASGPSSGDTFRKNPGSPVLERTVCGVVHFLESGPFWNIDTAKKS